MSHTQKLNRRSSRRLAPSLSMKGYSPHVGKLSKTKSITTAGIRRTVSRTEDISRATDHIERTYKPEKFKAEKLRAPPHSEATNLSSEHFDAEYYTEDLFAKKSVEEIKETVSTLTQQREETGKLLKKQVFSNYQRFLDSTSRLQQLENDMASLRRLFTEQNQSLYSLSTANASSISSASTNQLHKKESFRVTEEQKQIKNTLNVYDELDCLIAERKFSVVVDMLEKQLKNNENETKANIYYVKQIYERVQIVSELLCREIQNPSLKKSNCHKIIGYLVRLRESTVARDTLLNTRWEKISKILKEMKVDGELVEFIAQLSKTAFLFLSETCKEYQQMFPDPQMMSAFVVWATEVLDLFVAIFTRHVLTSQSKQSLAECLEIANQHCLVLENEGLMLSFYLQRALKKKHM